MTTNARVQDSNNNTVYYYNANGEQVSNTWVENDDSTWSYFGNDGGMLTGLQTVNNQTVYFDADGRQVKAAADKVTEDIKNDPDNKTLPEAIELPNTGVDKTESITITGVVMLILTTIFGLLFTSKKHKKD